MKTPVIVQTPDFSRGDGKFEKRVDVRDSKYCIKVGRVILNRGIEKKVYNTFVN